MGREALSNGLIRCIGNEKLTSAWNDPWIPRLENPKKYSFMLDAAIVSQASDLF